MQRNTSPSGEVRSPPRFVVAWGIALALYMLLVPTRVIGGYAAIAITDLAWTLASVLATVSCFRAVFASSGPDRLAWILFGSASAAWTAGQIAWDVQELVLGITVPFPSIADIGYLAFGPVMIAGLIALSSTQLEHRLTWLRLANMGLIFCGLAILLIVVLTQPFMRGDSPVGSSLVAVMESASVTIAFIVALYVLWTYHWNSRFEPVALITIALAIHTISHLFYTRELVTGQYGVLSVFNVGWIAAFAFQQWAGESQVAATKHADLGRVRAMQAKEGWVEALVPSVLVMCMAITAMALSEEFTPRVVLVGSLVLALFAVVLALREGLMHARGLQTRMRLQRASAELENSRLQLREVEAQRAVLQRDIDFVARAGSVGLWEWDLQTGVVRFSREWKRQLGYQENEIESSVEEWRSRLHPDDAERMENYLSEFLADPKGEFVAEQRLRHRDGTYRWILAQGSMLLDEYGKAERMLGSHVDITEQKNIELSLQESQRRYRDLVENLEARVAARTRELTEAYRESQSFSYAVAHDLKAPLRAIDGFSHLLEQSAMSRLDANERDYIQRVRRGAIQMASLIDGLLSYSRLEHRELRICAVDCREVIEDVVQTMTTAIQTSKAEVIVATPARRVHADVEGMRMVIRNLLDNALKFASPSRTPRIEIDGYEDNDCFVLTIRDNGIGFDPQYYDKIFEIFNRLHASGYEGTGIGLALVRKAVHRMQGRIWVQSALDQGATFFIRLPLADETQTTITS